MPSIKDFEKKTKEKKIEEKKVVKQNSEKFKNEIPKRVKQKGEVKMDSQSRRPRKELHKDNLKTEIASEKMNEEILARESNSQDFIREKEEFKDTPQFEKENHFESNQSQNQNQNYNGNDNQSYSQGYSHSHDPSSNSSDHATGQNKESITIEFPGSFILRSKFTKTFDALDKVATDWVNDGDFEGLPVGHPLAQILAAKALKKAKEVEKKAQNTQVYSLAKIGFEFAKAKLKK